MLHDPWTENGKISVAKKKKKHHISNLSIFLGNILGDWDSLSRDDKNRSIKNVYGSPISGSVKNGSPKAGPPKRIAKTRVDRTLVTKKRVDRKRFKNASITTGHQKAIDKKRVT